MEAYYKAKAEAAKAEAAKAAKTKADIEAAGGLKGWLAAESSRTGELATHPEQTGAAFGGVYYPRLGAAVAAKAAKEAKEAAKAEEFNKKIEARRKERDEEESKWMTEAREAAVGTSFVKSRRMSAPPAQLRRASTTMNLMQISHATSLTSAPSQPTDA